MGRESRIIKDRTCHHCREILYDVSVEYVQRHAKDCQRMQRAGLVMPTVVGRKELSDEV